MCDCAPGKAYTSEFGVCVKLARTKTCNGKNTAYVDPCIAPIVQSLNDAGLMTTASCCGHNERPGLISLDDGRVVMIVGYELAMKIDGMSKRDIHGTPTSDERNDHE